MDGEGPRLLAFDAHVAARIRLPERREAAPVVAQVTFQVDLATLVRERDEPCRVTGQRAGGQLGFVELQFACRLFISGLRDEGQLWLAPHGGGVRRLRA